MSVTPQHCKANQSSTEVPTDNAGSEIGAVLSLSIDRGIIFTLFLLSVLSTE